MFNSCLNFWEFVNLIICLLSRLVSCGFVLDCIQLRVCLLSTIACCFNMQLTHLEQSQQKPWTLQTVELDCIRLYRPPLATVTVFRDRVLSYCIVLSLFMPHNNDTWCPATLTNIWRDTMNNDSTNMTAVLAILVESICNLIASFV